MTLKHAAHKLAVMAVLCVGIAVGVAPCQAQQHDFDITTFDANTGSTMRAAINAALQSLAGLSSGATAPGTTYPYQLWMDTSTTPKTLKMRNSANTSWVALGTVSDAGAVVFTNAATAGGFTPSQTPGASQIPVLTTYGDLAIGSKSVLSTQGSGKTVTFYGGNAYANLSGTANSIVSVNAYTDIDNQWHYSSNGPAAIVNLTANGTYTFQTAPDGTAGAVISFGALKPIYHTGNDGNLMKVDAQAGGSHWVEVASGSSTRSAATYGVTLYTPSTPGHHLYMISVYASAGEASVGYMPSTTETRITVYPASVVNDRCGVRADWHSGGSSRTLYYKIWEWQ